MHDPGISRYWEDWEDWEARSHKEIVYLSNRMQKSCWKFQFHEMLVRAGVTKNCKLQQKMPWPSTDGLRNNPRTLTNAVRTSTEELNNSSVRPQTAFVQVH